MKVVRWIEAMARLATSPARPLPNTIIIGAQRAGTTSLFSYLAASADVATSIRKEVHFFDRHYRRGSFWYRSMFPMRAWGHTVRLEATPALLYWDDAARKVARLLPDVRLVVLLRDPVARAHSHYRHERAAGRETAETFEEALALEPERLRSGGKRARRCYSYVDRGIYVKQLERWNAYFPRDQMFVGLSDELYLSPERFVERVCAWLEVAPPVGYEYRTMNRAPGQAIRPDTAARLRDEFAGPDAGLADWLGRDLPWRS